MSDLDLKCGIEVHQQLEGKKLFCGCPTLLREDAPHFQVKRKLRASAGESGVVDIAAQQEQWKDKTFLYEGYYDTTCLVELDEEPPHEISLGALYTVLQFSKLVDATISPVIQVMRKTVVDGSNTSGFQRTALVARNGMITTSGGNVRIEGINLEEDAAKIVSETSAEKTYRLDRLGIPLIEIGTAPDITSPAQCLEAAKRIGLLLRSLPGVKRGLGTIRQDINISISGGNRVEIKGAQDLKQLPLLVELEVQRQQELLNIKQELQHVNLGRMEIKTVAPFFNTCASNMIQKTLRQHGTILGMKLNGFAGVVGRGLQPQYRLGTEFSGRAKVISGVGGIFHSDELPAYGISAEEVATLKKELKCTDNDAFILVADQEAKACRALEAVYARAQEVFVGVPAEVRRANPDGTTSFLRPMPGAARMYPETDVPLIKPTLKGITLPETLEEKIARYQQKLGLSKDLAELVAKSDHVMLFEELVALHPSIKPAFIAETVTSTLLEIKRKYALDADKIKDHDFRMVFRYLQENKIHKDIMLDVLIDICKGTFSLQRYASLGTEEIHRVLKEIVNQNKGAPFSALMGIAMKRLAGKASGQFISEHLKKIMEEGH